MQGPLGLRYAGGVGNDWSFRKRQGRRLSGKSVIVNDSGQMMLIDDTFLKNRDNQRLNELTMSGFPDSLSRC